MKDGNVKKVFDKKMGFKRTAGTKKVLSLQIQEASHHLSHWLQLYLTICSLVKPESDPEMDIYPVPSKFNDLIF